MSEIQELLDEYARVCNYIVEKYQEEIPSSKKEDKDKGPSKYSFCKKERAYDIILETGTFLSNTLVFNAMYETYAAVQGEKTKQADREDGSYFSPKFYGAKVVLPPSVAQHGLAKNTKDFDYFVKLRCLRNDKGHSYSITIPIKRHKQFNKWMNVGKICNSVVLTNKYVMFSFEVNVAEKKAEGNIVGFDFGMKRLGTLSNGDIIGEDIEKHLYELQRKKRCSKAYYRKKEEVNTYINTQIKRIGFDDKQLIVVENLKNMKYKMKERGRLSKNIRSVFYNLSYRQVMNRIEMLCEENRVSFRSIPAYFTSLTCPRCGHIEKGNRLSQESFVCQNCGYSDNADHNASINILKRFTTGKYGSGYQSYFNSEFPELSKESPPEKIELSGAG